MLHTINNNAFKNIITIAILAVVIIILSACQTNEKTDYQIALNITDSPGDSITVTWYTQNEDTSYVYYTESSVFDKEDTQHEYNKKGDITEIREDEYFRHSATLTGLKEGTEYAYCVGSEKQSSSTAYFTTESGSDNFKFMFLGDIQYQVRDRDYQTWGEYVKTAFEKNNDIELALLGGDMVDKSADVLDWSGFFNNGEFIFEKIPIATTVGNHETSIIPYTYRQMLSMPGNGPTGYEEEFYSFDYGDCHFLSLNSCFFMEERKNDFDSINQWNEALADINKWLEKDLKENDKSWTIVYMHHPPYPIEEDDILYKELREKWVPLFESGGVSAVFCGHQHVYMRTKEINGIPYFMSSSGEKPSYYYDESHDIPEYIEKIYQNKSYILTEVEKDILTIDVYNEKHKSIDSIQLKNSL